MIRRGAIGAIVAASLLLASVACVMAESARTPDFTYAGRSGAELLLGPWERIDSPNAIGAPTEAPSASVMFPMRPSAPDRASSRPGRGPAAYRMEIRIESPASKKMALYYAPFSGIAAVYADGAAVYDRDRDPAAPPLVQFEAPKGEVSLALRIKAGSPGLEDKGTYPSFILFGDAESVNRDRILLGFATAILDGFFFIAGIIVFILFLFWKKNEDFLAFALYLLVTGLYSSLEGGLLFLNLFPSIGRDALEILHAVALNFQYAALGYFIHTLYRERIKGPVAIAIYALPAALSAAALAFPSKVGVVWIAEIACYGAASAVVLAFFAVLAAKGDKKALWLIPAFLAQPAALAIQLLGPESLWNAYLLEPAAKSLFCVVVLLMLVKKVADAFKSTETLAGYVDSVTSKLRSFIPKEFLDHLGKDDVINLSLGDHAKKRMTIFFSDIRAFTELSERLTVEENFAFINSYLARVVPVINENGGFVDKYVGDGIMALFPGAKGPDDAIRAAIAIQAKMVEYNGHRAKMGYRPIKMGIGVHTGDLMLGVVGIKERMENTVISDAVNLGSRLQTIAKTFNLGLVISDQAFKELEDPGAYKSRFIGKVKVKGKSAPISVFEIFDGIAQDLFNRKMEANMFFEQGMLAYYRKDFAGAMENFKKTLEIVPHDGAASFYLENSQNKGIVEAT
jgi:adenylate cyclase